MPEPAAAAVPVPAVLRSAGERDGLRVLFASLVGTTVEFYDFYIYGIASALVIGPVFFPGVSPAAQSLSAFLTFGIAFLARPLGAAVFGHFGDRVGRKSMLVASLLVMGTSTVLIGALPGYSQAGWLAPALLCLMRLGQGVGLGGEWGGAALLAVENAPPGRRGWFGMVPQLGPPIGFLLANGTFLLLDAALGERRFGAWGWRLPFLGSAVLVALGLYVRVSLHETASFAGVLDRGLRVRVPLAAVLARHWRPLLLGSAAMMLPYVLFYVSTVFALRYGTAIRHIPRTGFLGLLCVAVLAMAATTPLAGAWSDRFGRRPVLLAGMAARRRVRLPDAAAAGRGRHRRRAAVPGDRAGADGAGVRADGRAAAGAVPGLGALHRRLGRLQPGRHPRRPRSPPPWRSAWPSGAGSRGSAGT